MNKINWHRVTKEGFPPKPENRKDIDVILKVENAPMLYIAAVWDGETFWMLFPMEKSPWIPVPSWIGITDWAYIEER